MAGELVFITGATGFVGFAVLGDLLKTGYKVRVSVRKESQIVTLKEHPIIEPFTSKVDFVVVPDITAEGAFDGVLDGVSFIEHIASPLPRPTEDPERDIILPAIRGTTSILNSALKVSSIRRVVITSSIVAIIPGEALSKNDSTTIYTSSSRVRPLPTAPWGNFGNAYRVAKVLALDATERFIAEKKPHFSIVNIMPGYVIGANALAKDTKGLADGSNGVPLAIIVGIKSQAPRPGVIAHIDDVVRIHVGALDESKVNGNKDLLLDVGHVRYDDAIDIAKKEFPDAVKEGILPLGGSGPAVNLNVDASETVELFGPLKSYEEAIKSVLANFIALKTES